MGSFRWVVGLLGLMLYLLLFGRTVSAAEDPAASARTDSAFSVLYERAQAAYQAGQYADAIEALLVAYKLQPEPRLLYNIAQAHRKLGNIQKSREYFEQYLAADREIPADMREEINRHITELTAQERAAAPPPVQTPTQSSPAPPITGSSQATKDPAPYQMQRWHKVLGSVLILGGVGLLTSGITFLALDGRCTEPVVPPAVQCGRVYQLQTPGAAQLALGGGLLIGGTLTLVIPSVRATRSRSLAPGGSAQAR